MTILIDLDPRWVGAGGAGVYNADGTPARDRHGVGISFRCPCGSCGDRVYVAFENQLDGGPPHMSPGQAAWHRTGETFYDLTLHPSILRGERCRWHGWVTRGEVTTCQ